MHSSDKNNEYVWDCTIVQSFQKHPGVLLNMNRQILDFLGFLISSYKATKKQKQPPLLSSNRQALYQEGSSTVTFICTRGTLSIEESLSKSFGNPDTQSSRQP